MLALGLGKILSFSLGSGTAKKSELSLSIWTSGLGKIPRPRPDVRGVTPAFRFPRTNAQSICKNLSKTFYALFFSHCYPPVSLSDSANCRRAFPSLIFKNIFSSADNGKSTDSGMYTASSLYQIDLTFYLREAVPPLHNTPLFLSYFSIFLTHIFSYFFKLSA